MCFFNLLQIIFSLEYPCNAFDLEYYRGRPELIYEHDEVTTTGGYYKGKYNYGKFYS